MNLISNIRKRLEIPKLQQLDRSDRPRLSSLVRCSKKKWLPLPAPGHVANQHDLDAAQIREQQVLGQPFLIYIYMTLMHL